MSAGFPVCLLGGRRAEVGVGAGSHPFLIIVSSFPLYDCLLWVARQIPVGVQPTGKPL